MFLWKNILLNYMEAYFYDRQGNIIEDITKAAGGLFDGNDAVDSSVIVFDDEQEQKKNVFSYNEFHPIMGENNISVFIDPKNRIFNILARTDDFDGKQIGTSISFTEEEYLKFVNFIRVVSSKDFGSSLNS